MSFFDCIYQLIIGPLKLIFEFIFVRACNVLGNPGFAIVFLSIAMNFLVLPLYRRADKMQEEVRDREKSLEPWVSHIKKTFSGNEQMMILSAYYRQRGYKPLHALKGSISLLLEIPFFMAAYSFLSKLEILNGTKFGPILDLGSPDGLIHLGSTSINLLPILMTIINIIATAIYLKGFPLKSKIQMYGIAAIFLVLLYSSPAGLVFYWTLNNLFSLGKNIFYKLKNPRKVINVCTSIIGLALFVFLLAHPSDRIIRQIVLYSVCFALQIPLAISILKKYNKKNISLFVIPEATKTENKIFIASCSFLAILTGALIPSALIDYSTFEFMSSYSSVSPLWYIVSASLYAIGLFVIWFGIFYYLASPKAKTLFSYFALFASLVALVDYMFFGTEYGNLSSVLVFDKEPIITISDILINGIVVFVIAIICLFALRKAKLVKGVCYILCVAVLSMSLINVVGINNNLKDIANNENSELKQNAPQIPLSSDGQNVIVLMLDRAVSTYIPYLFNEKPELKEQFAGFTYYPNTLTMGANTLIGLPETLGGYEYSPEEVNKRDDVLLSNKHDEALKLMPTIFSNEGYTVTVGNPTHAGYVYNSDISIYDDIENVTAFKTKGKLTTGLDDADQLISSETQYSRFRNFFTYSLFKTSPVALQNYIYAYGNYNSSHVMNGSISTQVVDGLSKAHGLTESYLDNYSVLVNLKELTSIQQTTENSFFMLCSELTHVPTLLQTPDYTPAMYVDNTEYDKNNLIKHSAFDDSEIELSNTTHLIHYHINMQAFLLLGDWFDYLRDNNVFDNTRIILVSDHGYHLGHAENKYGAGEWDDVSRYNPILLVKDFDSKNFAIDTQFMTNADVPTLAFDGLIENPVNPFTGNPVKNDIKDQIETILIYTTDKVQPDQNNGNVFSFSNRIIVTITDDLLNPEFWRNANE